MLGVWGGCWVCVIRGVVWYEGVQCGVCVWCGVYWGRAAAGAGKGASEQDKVRVKVFPSSPASTPLAPHPGPLKLLPHTHHQPRAENGRERRKEILILPRFLSVSSSLLPAPRTQCQVSALSSEAS